MRWARGGGRSGANATRTDHIGLPRTKACYHNPFPERRHAEDRAKGAFSCWQLAGAGAVGSQVLMGLPVLARLRARFAGHVAVWPFEPLAPAPVAFVEIWPTLVDPAVRAGQDRGEIRDAAQVRILAHALKALDPARLAAMLADDAPEEGWILGLGSEQELLSACP